jgi:hypothetical protein
MFSFIVVVSFWEQICVVISMWKYVVVHAVERRTRVPLSGEGE